MSSPRTLQRYEPICYPIHTLRAFHHYVPKQTRRLCSFMPRTMSRRFAEKFSGFSRDMSSPSMRLFAPCLLSFAMCKWRTDEIQRIDIGRRTSTMTPYAGCFNRGCTQSRHLRWRLQAAVRHVLMRYERNFWRHRLNRARPPEPSQMLTFTCEHYPRTNTLDFNWRTTVCGHCNGCIREARTVFCPSYGPKLGWLLTQTTYQRDHTGRTITNDASRWMPTK